MKRRDAIDIILRRIAGDDLVLTTTGMISRETFDLHDRPGNFYMIGSMGLLSAVGLGLALQKPGRRVVVIEGDGSALMSLGSLALIAAESPPNLIHVILDNEAYESTGGQPSISSELDLAAVAQAAGYRAALTVADENALEQTLARLLPGAGPSLVLAKVTIDSSHDVPRVSHTPEQIRDRFAAAVALDPRPRSS